MKSKSRAVSVSLCLMTWNEIKGCKADVHRLPLRNFDEVYAVDGGSDDGTVEYLCRMGIKVFKQPKRGYNQAYIYAINLCKSDALVFFHPKGTTDPATLSLFKTYFESGADLIIGSRMISGGFNEEDVNFWRPRKWFVLGLSILAYLIWKRQGPWIRDVLHGYRGVKKKIFKSSNLLEEGLSADIEMVINCYRNRFSMIEFPVKEKSRLAGETHFKAFETGFRILRYIWFELWRKL